MRKSESAPAVRVLRREETQALFPELMPGETLHGELHSVGIIEEGMPSGEPAVVFAIGLPDGRAVVFKVGRHQFRTLIPLITQVMEGLTSNASNRDRSRREDS